MRARIATHLQIMRLDHSLKNIFVIPGIVVPLSVLRSSAISWTLARNIGVGFVATTLIACSNYVVNEVLDAPFDKLHPVKKFRPAALGLVNVPAAYIQWILMMIAGMALAFTVSAPFAWTAAALWIMGCVYNISPVRTKDKAYLDVLTESVNNPLRLLLGWFMVTTTLVPPISLQLCYWMAGCYLMALKRFSEFREIDNAEIAGAYRRSFRRYTQVSLLSSVTFYAAAAMLFFGAFIMRYRIELVLVFPLVALIMSTYFQMAFQPHSAVQNPEKLYREPVLMLEVIALSCATVGLLYFDIPRLAQIFAPTLPSALRH